MSPRIAGRGVSAPVELAHHVSFEAIPPQPILWGRAMEELHWLSTICARAAYARRVQKEN
jgi:hypothetical protein